MAIIRARRSVFGDAIDDALAGSCGDALMTPSFAAQSSLTSSAPPQPAPQSTGMVPICNPGTGQSWTDVFKGVVSGLFAPSRYPPGMLNRPYPQPTSTSTTVLVVGGLGLLGLVAYLVTRKS